MSNQRAAKTYRAAMGQDGRVTLFEIIDFLEAAVHALEQHDEGDAAFYFEQLREHLIRSPHKGFKEDVSKVLGV